MVCGAWSRDHGGTVGTESLRSRTGPLASHERENRSVVDVVIIGCRCRDYGTDAPGVRVRSQPLAQTGSGGKRALGVPEEPDQAGRRAVTVPRMPQQAVPGASQETAGNGQPVPDR